ncbi:protein-disulfide reductase DsbD domain-containing protein [Hoeflea sp. TYP-13]|uniref:protein-disulfide reductase DsbD domain-containing protein n=1 Tax=Hoeflea sp. TYP-13 TaxID=3230023 RepID=UPI0034C69CE4
MIKYCFTTYYARSATFALVVAGIFLTPAGTEAASSDWVETDGGRIRISALPPSEDGSIQAVLDVELLPGWKTYWRDPGEAGVPPSFRVERSDNIASAEIHFPPPERIRDDYSVWAGYNYPVVFPITLQQATPGKSSVLEADVFLGICKSICIPFQTSFSLEIDPDKPANSFEKRLVKKAYRSLPEEPGNGFEIVESRVNDDGGTLVLSVATPQENDVGELFVTGPQGWRFDTPKLAGRKNNVATYHVSASGISETDTLSGKTVRIVVKAAGRSMETELDLP